MTKMGKVSKNIFSKKNAQCRKSEAGPFETLLKRITGNENMEKPEE